MSNDLAGQPLMLCLNRPRIDDNVRFERECARLLSCPFTVAVGKYIDRDAASIFVFAAP